jgi:hypothetical protein
MNTFTGSNETWFFRTLQHSPPMENILNLWYTSKKAARQLVFWVTLAILTSVKLYHFKVKIANILQKLCTKYQANFVKIFEVIIHILLIKSNSMELIKLWKPYLINTALQHHFILCFQLYLLNSPQFFGQICCMSVFTTTCFDLLTIRYCTFTVELFSLRCNAPIMSSLWIFMLMCNASYIYILLGFFTFSSNAPYILSLWVLMLDVMILINTSLWGFYIEV